MRGRKKSDKWKKKTNVESECLLQVRSPRDATSLATYAPPIDSRIPSRAYTNLVRLVSCSSSRIHLRLKIGSCPRRRILDAVIARHVLGNYSHRISRVPGQKQGRSQSRHAGPRKEVSKRKGRVHLRHRGKGEETGLIPENNNIGTHGDFRTDRRGSSGIPAWIPDPKQKP